VDDTAVAPGLVLRDLMLLLEHGDRGIGPQLGQSPRDCKTDDSGTDDAYSHAGHLAAFYLNPWTVAIRCGNPAAHGDDPRTRVEAPR
jgi:hypothetical protein